jgi:prevent-host-death family protein
MTSIGVRELRQRASSYLRRVEAGETIEITDRGRPVALLSPIPDRSTLERLRASGDLAPATAETLPEPVDPAPDTDAPSTILARLRDDER